MNEQNTELQPTTKSPFNQIVQTGESGNEYWSARDLMTLLGYTQWRNFQTAIERAKHACKNAGTLENS
ncbi:MAG: BRO family protein [Cyanobacteria bacterium P01_H01_bin.105]